MENEEAQAAGTRPNTPVGHVTRDVSVTSCESTSGADPRTAPTQAHAWYMVIVGPVQITRFSLGQLFGARTIVGNATGPLSAPRRLPCKRIAHIPYRSRVPTQTVLHGDADPASPPRPTRHTAHERRHDDGTVD